MDDLTDSVYDLMEEFNLHLRLLNEEGVLIPNQVYLSDEICSATQKGKDSSFSSDVSNLEISKNPSDIADASNNGDDHILYNTEKSIETTSSDAWDFLVREALECKKCRLCNSRKNIVFGIGEVKNPPIMFIGEGPGAEEDDQGKPFVGKSGQLLTRAIENGIGLSRSDVYICNVVKCRPPENRTPMPDEMQACLNFLERQILFVKPRVIIALGGVALKALAGDNVGSISTSRGVWLNASKLNAANIPVIATYHPAYLLRKPEAKALFWQDLKMVMSFLGIERKSVTTQA